MHDTVILFVLLVIVFTLLIWGRWRYDLVAFAALMVAVVAGVIPVEQAFFGFGPEPGRTPPCCARNGSRPCPSFGRPLLRLVIFASMLECALVYQRLSDCQRSNQPMRVRTGCILDSSDR